MADLSAARPLTPTRVIVELHNGRQFDITGKAGAAAIQYLRDHGVRLSDIKNTIHYISGALPERIEWP